MIMKATQSFENKKGAYAIPAILVFVGFALVLFKDGITSVLFQNDHDTANRVFLAVAIMLFLFAAAAFAFLQWHYSKCEMLVQLSQSMEEKDNEIANLKNIIKRDEQLRNYALSKGYIDGKEEEEREHSNRR